MHRYTSVKAYKGTGSKDIYSVSPFITKVCLRNVQTCFRFVCMFLRRMIKISDNMTGVLFLQMNA